LSPWEETYFIKKSIANNEEMKAVINPTKRGRNGNVENWLTALKNSTKAANDIAGIPRRKEYLAASFLFQPDNRAIEIVDPERDTPGKIAKACAIPIYKLFIYLWLFKLIDLLVEISAKSIINDINIETKAIERFERKNESENPGTKSFIIPPIKTIGIVPTIIDLYNLVENNEYLSLIEFVFLKLKILFLKYQNIAKTLPICIIADKEDPGSLIPNNRDTIFKWAVLLTGINSVKPWIIP